MASIPRLRLHGDADLVGSSELDGAGVAGVGVAEDACAGIAGEDTLQSALGIFSAVSDHNHAGVLRETNANAAAIVN